MKVLAERVESLSHTVCGALPCICISIYAYCICTSTCSMRYVSDCFNILPRPLSTCFCHAPACFQGFMSFWMALAVFFFDRKGCMVHPSKFQPIWTGLIDSFPNSKSALKNWERMRLPGGAGRRRLDLVVSMIFNSVSNS